jgi:large subunit ribosomal protein L35
MAKMKPHKGMSKRVKVTGTGKVLRKKAGKRHLMSSKTSKRRRQLGSTQTLDKADQKRVKRLLGL